MKISPFTILVACIAISMIVLTYGFSKRQPTMVTVENYNKYRDAMRTEQAKWPQAVAKVQAATKQGQQVVNDWNAIAATHTMPASPDPLGIDLTIDGYRLATLMPQYRNKIQALVNNQVKIGGVTVVQGPVVPLPPASGDQVVSGYFHFPQIDSPVLVFDLGTITVTGTYQQIADNVKAWKNMPHFLAVADGLRLQGTSPKLTGTYAVSIVGFVAVPKDANGNPMGIFPPLPEGAKIVSDLTPVLPAGGAPPGAGVVKGPGVPGPGQTGVRAAGATAGKPPVTRTVKLPAATVVKPPVGQSAAKPPVGQAGKPAVAPGVKAPGGLPAGQKAGKPAGKAGG
jgi:hypothetical protein